MEKGRRDEYTSSSAAMLGMVGSFEFRHLLGDLVKKAVASAMQVFCSFSFVGFLLLNFLVSKGVEHSRDDTAANSGAGKKKKRKTFASEKEAEFFHALQSHFDKKGMIDIGQSRHSEVERQIACWIAVMGDEEPFTKETAEDVAGKFQKRLAQARQTFSKTALGLLRAHFPDLPVDLSKVVVFAFVLD